MVVYVDPLVMVSTEGRWDAIKNVADIFTDRFANLVYMTVKPLATSVPVG